MSAHEEFKRRALMMPMSLLREQFVEVVAELVGQRGFVPPLSMVGVADDGSIFGVRFVQEDGELQANLVCQYVEVQFGLPMNVMVVDDTNSVARVLFGNTGTRVVTVL
jgi:hypothetical protein